jgi:hypothetical protein
VIFFSFWLVLSINVLISRQGVVIAVMVHFNLVIEGAGDWTQADVATAAQNFIICIEMLPCAIAYALTFGHKSFKVEY